MIILNINCSCKLFVTNFSHVAFTDADYVLNRLSEIMKNVHDIEDGYYTIA
jgi:hypothetical protein